MKIGKFESYVFIAPLCVYCLVSIYTYRDYISPETLNIEIKLATQNTVNSSSFFPVPAKGSALKRLCSIFFSSSKLCNEDDLDSRLSSSLEMKNEARGISKNFETISTVFQSISDLNNQDAKISPGK